MEITKQDTIIINIISGSNIIIIIMIVIYIINLIIVVEYHPIWIITNRKNDMNTVSGTKYILFL